MYVCDKTTKTILSLFNIWKLLNVCTILLCIKHCKYSSTANECLDDPLNINVIIVVLYDCALTPLNIYLDYTCFFISIPLKIILY